MYIQPNKEVEISLTRGVMLIRYLRKGRRNTAILQQQKKHSYITRDLRLEKNPSNSEHIISEHRLFRADNYFSEQEYFFRARIFFPSTFLKIFFFQTHFLKIIFFEKGCRKIRAIPSKLFPSTDISEQVFIFPSRYLFSEQEIIFRAGIYFSEQIIIFLA